MKRVATIISSAFILFVCLACFAGTKSDWDSLPSEDRDKFNRCRTKLENNICGDNEADENVVYSSMCMRKAIQEYSNTSDKDDWLTSHGCPPYMVN